MSHQLLLGVQQALALLCSPTYSRLPSVGPSSQQVLKEVRDFFLLALEWLFFHLFLGWQTRCSGGRRSLTDVDVFFKEFGVLLDDYLFFG